MSKKTQEHLVSIFDSAISTKQSELSLNDYFAGIQSGKWQDEVLNYRAGKCEKTKVHAVTASGLFSGRKDSELQEHSGVLVIDIDDKDQQRPMLEIKEQLREVPEVFAIHSSLGGKGLAVYFRIKKDKHFESFDAISKFLANDYGVISDLHCSNIGRLRFVSYDPDCYLNYGASVWNYFDKKEDREQPKSLIFSENDITFIVAQIRERQLNIAPDYYSWLRIGFSLASKLGDGGRDAFRLISGYYYGKQKINPDKQFDRCLKAGKSGITISSFFYYAKLAGCTLVSERTKKITTIGKIRRKQEQQSGSGSLVSGREDAKQYLLEFEGISGKDVDDVLDQVWKAPLKDMVSEEGLLYDIELFLKSNYKFRLNEITSIVEVEGEPMNDYLFNSIYLKCTKVIDKANKDKVFDLIHSDFTPKYNPIHEWFDKNKHIKTSGNITKLASCISSDLTAIDNAFVADYLEKWLLSIIASAHGIYSILCLVLTGQVQGTGKTNFFRELLPEPLRWLFSINKLDGKEADIGQLMCSKWLILDDEFGGKSKQDEKRFKELISKDVFSIRKPYGRYFEDMKRLSVLCGTTNEEQVINDLTGNRRIIPIQVNYIDEVKFAEVDKTELFIELYWKFRENPKSFFLTKADIERLNRVCFDANQVAAELELPQIYFEKSSRSDRDAKFLSSSEIRSIIEIRSGIRLSQQKLSVTMKNLGFDKEFKRINGNNGVNGFWVKVKGFEQEQPMPQAKQEAKQEDLPF
jgi:hypothetical protein